MIEEQLDWDGAIQHVNETLEAYKELVGIPGVIPFFGMAYITSLKKRYLDGERTAELYREMMDCE